MSNNIPALDVTYDKDLDVILPIDPAKNTLLLGLDAALMKAKHFSEDMLKWENNIATNRLGM